ncbi:conjugal transfer protein TraF [Geobacter sulfurreducens]|uniref:Thioredoxin-related domain protein n=1 Tax=Geobacter sulfurreducens (strain ATCC 51573 / DSM 12127 / PCA) TaxID=243231 RepID=Q74BB7_GEOSL|nr:conjugal transfer protein TraF [Geobacter sulfurreducens]AAR35500.1 thioredoxin-related domain protein [Geobacter sulfurreducens PCA]UAC02850.1 conjugal transfer protein TraF [Geobacter sulfurreducens]HCD97592.1 conjugal transfer protein TraF [Geobacter sulfurreducens]
MRWPLMAAAMLSLSVSASASYYTDSATGWWWYQKEPEKQAEKPARKKKPAKPVPSLKDYTYEQIWEMHPDQFQEFAEALKKKAVQKPSEENVKEYFEVQEIARKKALAFSNVAQFVWQKYPELTTKKDYPITTPGNLARISQINEERQRVLRDNRDDFALVYFQRPDCSYCDEQSRILDWFTNETGWTVKKVNISENTGLAAKFSVEITPTLILIQKGNQDYLPVSAGVISADEIEDKAYRAVRLLRGDISPEEYSLYEFQKGGGFDVKKRRLQDKNQP